MAVPAFPADFRPTRPLPDSSLEEAVQIQTASSPVGRLDDFASQELTKLVQRLFLTTDSQLRAVTFAGIEAANGSAFAAASTAEILAAHTSGNVCVLDCDLDRPTLHQHFALANGNGTSEALSAGVPIRESARRVQSRLWVVSAGRGLTASLTRQNLQELKAELLTSFEYVILAAPPISLAPAALMLAQSSDGLVMVLEAGSTRRESAQKVTQDFQRAGVSLLAAILNNRTFPIPAALYARL
jgi:Mrp family chromosome partitioning ATPase